MTRAKAEILREYGPFPEIDAVHGVTFDGQLVWFASGDRLNALDPENGETVGRIDTPARAGTAFDGRYFYQIAEGEIRRIDPATGAVLHRIPAPGQNGASGLAWAEGFLWVGQHGDGSILQLDPETGSVLRRIASDRFVTGVTWVAGELWHGNWQDGESELRRIDPATGAVLASLEMPDGTNVSGLESDGGERLFCGGGRSGTIRAVRRPHSAPDQDSQ
jgi:outer membrane protein assembly factor BamB